MYMYVMLFGFTYACVFVCVVVLLHIDLFSFSWLQVCLSKFSSANSMLCYRALRVHVLTRTPNSVDTPLLAAEKIGSCAKYTGS